MKYENKREVDELHENISNLRDMLDEMLDEIDNYNIDKQLAIGKIKIIISKTHLNKIYNILEEYEKHLLSELEKL